MTIISKGAQVWASTLSIARPRHQSRLKVASSTDTRACGLIIAAPTLTDPPSPPLPPPPRWSRIRAQGYQTPDCNLREAGEVHLSNLSVSRKLGVRISNPIAANARQRAALAGELMV
jgi:hypothetical protein